ncbi:MAG: terminase small subunit [Caulobacter sp.]|nr:terminase small subunit [Caulobacter sp.]
MPKLPLPTAKVARTSPDYPLTARQRRFVEAYLAEPNATAAAVRAGYKPWTAGQIGYQQLQRPNVQAALNAAHATRHETLTRAMVIEELRRVAFSNLMDYVRLDRHEDRLDLDLTQLDHARAAGLRELTIEESYNGRTKTSRRDVRVKMGPKVFALSRLLSLLPPDEAGAAPQIDFKPASPSPQADFKRTSNKLQTRAGSSR